MYCYSEDADKGYYMCIGSLANAHLPSLRERVDERIREGYRGKASIRKDAVRQLNVILSGSHEQMTAIGRNKKALSAWIYDNYRFVAREYGRRNIVGFVVHLDEATPHIHATIVPLTPDGRLSAKDVVGDQRRLKGLQDRYGEAMAKYGLARGLSNSKAKHIETREYYRHINAAATAVEAAVEQAPAVELPPVLGREAYRQELQQHIAVFAAKSAQKLKESEYKRLILARENNALKSQILAKKMATPSPALASSLNKQRTIRRQEHTRRGKGMGL
jgi:hypothetical protein